MIVSKQVSPWLIVKIEGVWILVFAVLSSAVYVFHHYFDWSVEVPLSVVATLGTAVAILLGFKNNSAYDRWWEARKIWGGIVNQSRYFGTQLIAYMEREVQDETCTDHQVVKELVFRHLAYINVLSLHLRGLDTQQTMDQWLLPEEKKSLSQAKNQATQILTNQSRRLRHFHEATRWEQFRLFELMATVREFFELQGKAERIKNTPLMRHYSWFTTAFVWFFVLLLPFGFVGQMDWKMIPLTILVSTIFTILDRAGTFTEAPFNNEMNDVAMSAICRTIEIDMLQQIEFSDIPEPLVPVNGVLM